MKIAFIFSVWSTGNRPLDFSNLFSSPRGLTGSDLGICLVASECAKLGHDVSLYTSYTDPATKPATWQGVKLYNISECNESNTSEYDVLITWSDPNPFFSLSKKPLRVVYQMINDFMCYSAGFNDVVDLWFTVSEGLQQHLMSQPTAPPANKWGAVIPLGCDPSWYKETPRVPGRVIWTSSADRGLHLLLQEWPKIKAAVPEAHLRVFYNFAYDHLINIEAKDTTIHHTVIEMAYRARYMQEAMKRLKSLGVESIGSVSRDRMAQELNEAVVLAYPCSTVAFTEGFSVSILESCAAGVLPVISARDCLGSIYRGHVPMVENPIEQHMDEFVGLVVRGLTDETFRSEAVAKCKAFATDYTWTKCAAKLIENIKTARPSI
jgi:glycosyltransferase involved in cell wall biosynthesis